jgi:hypothetical protein
MQDDYVAQIANMLVALYQRRSFMVCDPSKRLGACHDAALDDRDRLESVRMMRVSIVKKEIFQVLRVGAVIMRAEQVCICCISSSFSDYFSFFNAF